MTAMLATGSFSRTKENKRTYTQMAVSKDQQGDRVFFRDAAGTSSDFMASFQRQSELQRSDGFEKQKANQMLFTGTGSFLAQKQLYDQKDMSRRENADATS